MYIPKHRAVRVTTRQHVTRLSTATFGVVAIGAGALSLAPSAASAAPVRAAAPAAVVRAAAAPAAAVRVDSSHVVAAGTVRSASQSAAVRSAVIRGKAVRAAASRKGTPYRHGAAGPRAFDCSGLTQWSYRQAGLRIPRTSAAQYRATHHVSKSAKRPGDLIFYHTGSGHVYHVGIYAGNNKVWVARHTGTRITLQKIYTSSYYVGRVV